MSQSEYIYCLDPRTIDKAKSEVYSGRRASDVVYSLLRRPNGGFDGLLLALLRTYGTDSYFEKRSYILGHQGKF